MLLFRRAPTRLDLLACALALVLGGCLYQPADIGTEPAPARVYSTYPADGADHVGPGTDVVVTFRDDRDLETIRLRLLPPPLSAGTPRIEGRSIVWPDVETGATPPGQVLVVDGPTMVRPVQATWYPGTAGGNHGRFEGEITLEGRRGAAEGALVLAVEVRPEDSLTLDDLGIFLARDPASGTLAEPDETGTLSLYSMRFLEIGKLYVVIVILDTSSDGSYVAGEDRWGTFLTPEARLGVVVARGFDLSGQYPAPEWRTDVDVDLARR